MLTVMLSEYRMGRQSGPTLLAHTCQLSFQKLGDAHKLGKKLANFPKAKMKHIMHLNTQVSNIQLDGK